MISLSEGGGRPDSANHFTVVQAKPGKGVKVMNPPKPGQELSPAEALSFAAWLVAMCDASEADVISMLAEIAKK